MQALPVFLDVRNKRCLLVGEGELAIRKTRLLDKAGATVIAVAEAFSEDQLQDVALVVAASADNALNERVSLAAKSRNIPVNVVDQPGLCTFIFPAIVERGPVTVAISSGGAVPVLTRLLRARIESLLPDSLGAFAQQMAQFRKRVSERLPDMQQRLRFWDGLLQQHIIGAAANLDQSACQSEFNQQLEKFLAGSTSGLVSVVGAGSGAVDLLTFRALRCLQACDVVIFDENVAQPVIDLARRDARQIAITQQHDVFSVLKNEFAAAAHIVYLKMGDPMSYRDTPLLLARLQAEGLAYDVVPGIIDQAGAVFDAI